MTTLGHFRRRLVYFLVALFLPCYAADVVNPTDFAGKPITQIRFDPAKQPLTEQQLSSLVALKPNTPLQPAAIRDSIKKLFATGRYAYVEADAEPTGGGVTLVFRTRDQWFIGPVQVNGKASAPPNRGQLENAAQLELGEPFVEESLQSAVDNMRDLLKRNGFYEGTVEPSLERDSEHQQVSVAFLVKPGHRARLTEPRITGEPVIPAQKLARAAKYKRLFRWKQATDENVQGGIQRIRGKYDKDDRLTATVRLEDRQYDPQTRRVKPVINAKGGPKVKIKAVGAKVSKGKIERYVPVFDEQTVNRDLLVQGARNLRDYFQNQGYFDADVGFEMKSQNADLQEITYVVNPGPRHKLVDIQVHGNRYFKVDDLRERMYLQPAGFLRMRHGRYSEGFLKRDEDSIRELYRANGFRDVKVASTTLNDYKGKAGEVAVRFEVEEGPQWTVSDFRLTGVLQVDARRIRSNLACIVGQPFSENNVAMDRDFILSLYQGSGFPDATFDWKLTPGPGPSQAQVEYFITEGKQRFVRDLLITGMHKTRGRLVNPNILVKAGDPLSWNDMGRMQRRLYQLGVFDKVDMAVQNPDGVTENKYVLYDLEEGHRYSVAVGFGGEFARIGGSQTSLDNPAGQAGFSPRGLLEVSRLNMFGLGHTLSFKSRYSTLDRRFSLSYMAPRYRNVDGRNISITALYDDTRDVRTFTGKREEISAQLSQRLSRATTVFWRYSYRNVSVVQSSLKISPLLLPLVSQPARIGMFSSSLVRDRRDDPSDAHRGIYSTLDVGLAAKPFASGRNFGRLLVRNSYYHQIGHGGSVLAHNFTFGVLKPFSVAPDLSSAQYIPLPERFYGGGSTSHRGFPDNQAGPRDAETGFPLGGNALLFSNLEYRFPFIGDNIDGVLFHDMGNIYSNLSNISFGVHQPSLTDFNYMVHAAGFGVRYRTPIGPIRLDLAYSINPPSFYGFKGTLQELLLGQGTRTFQNTSHFQFFFSIGQTF